MWVWSHYKLLIGFYLLHNRLERPLKSANVVWVPVNCTLLCEIHALLLDATHIFITYSVYGWLAEAITIIITSHRQKEIHLPFPQEHPYTSHISRFTIFPDTASNNMVNAQTQTGNPPLIYEVSHKAGDSDRRVECRHLRTPGDLNLTSGAGTMLWDLPRSQRHKV